MSKRRNMRTHPAYGCTPTQIAAFERICINDDTNISKKTGAALIAKGLIVRREEKSRQGALVFIIYRYDPDPQAQFAWIHWCGENVDDEE